MITTMVFDPADRLSSFERVAALARATQPATPDLPRTSQPQPPRPEAAPPRSSQIDGSRACPGH